MEAADSTTVQIACPQCLAANRVPGSRMDEDPKCGKCGSSLLDPHPTALQEASFDSFVGRTQLPVVVDFWAEWCGPCRAMAPSFEKAAATLSTRVRFAKVDTEHNRALASRLGIHSIPTLILFQQGREVDRISGAMDASRLIGWVTQRPA